MRRIFVPVFLLLLFHLTAVAQTPADSSVVTDTTREQQADTVAAQDTAMPNVPVAITKRPVNPAAEWNLVPGYSISRQILAHHPYFRFSTRAVVQRSNLHLPHDKDTLFYAIVGLVFLFAILKLGFAKYFNDLFRVFFRTTMKQRQIREQLIQTPLPSLLFNLFFVLTTGLYLNFLLRDKGFKPVDHFWIMYLYCCAGLAVIYFVKFVALKICGWIFNVKHAADSYIFIIFIINKMIGIFLLPVVVLLAFGSSTLFTVVTVLSWCGIGALLLYRFVLAFSAVRNDIRFNLFHFLLYLAAFEIVPLLLIYRVLLSLI